MPANPSPKNLVSKLDYALPKIRLALVRESGKGKQSYAISCPKDAAKFLEPLRHAPEEHFVSLHLNAKNEVMGLHEVSHGTLSASLVHPREVFKAAVVGNCFAILVCHNHPSGAVLSPSKEDLDTTRQLLKAGKILGVSLMDHLIIGGDSESMSVYSIRENHPRIWDDPFGQLS
jgi:DNA repair protein RadC